MPKNMPEVEHCNSLITHDYLFPAAFSSYVAIDLIS
jgi:hypothetical protein